MRRFLTLSIALFTLLLVGCEKWSDNDLRGRWVGLYEYYDYNDQGEYVAFSQRVTFTLDENYLATKQIQYYEGSEYLEDESYTLSGNYSRSSTTLTLWYDEYESTSSTCACTITDSDPESYEYIYTEEYVDDEPEDEDDTDDYPYYRILKLRLVDDDDPYTEWVTFREE